MLLQKLYFLKKALKQQWMKPEELEKLQEKRLKALIKHTYQNVIFYRKKWKSSGIRPEDIKSLKDLKKLPIIKRDEVVRNYNYFIAENYRLLYKLGKVLIKTTSGTLGTPMKMIFDEVGEDYLEGIYLRTFLSLGYNIRKPLAYYWHEPFKEKFYNHLGFLKKNLISTKLNEEEQIKILQNLNPEYICYFPSSLFSISKKVLNENMKIRPKFIATQGEILSNKMRKLIQTAFNAPVYDFYATTETGITAWECKERSGYHINSDNVIMNFVYGDEEVSSGECGSIILTSLMNYIFPLIRYEIGDLGIPLNEKCSCGRCLPLMKGIEGRIKDIPDLEKKVFIPKFLIDSIADMPLIYKFKFVQYNKNYLEVRIVPLEKLSSDYIEKIKKRIKKVLKINIRINIVNEIQKEKTGKRIMFEMRYN